MPQTKESIKPKLRNPIQKVFIVVMYQRYINEY